MDAEDDKTKSEEKENVKSTPKSKGRAKNESAHQIQVRRLAAGVTNGGQKNEIRREMASANATSGERRLTTK